MTNHNTMQTSKFKLVALSKPKFITCETIDNNKERFHPKIAMTDERFEKLFEYCKGHWEDEKIVTIAHDGLTDDGVPINGVVFEIIES